MNHHVHVFTRDNRLYECSCDTHRSFTPAALLPTARSEDYWTVRMSTCEVRGPDCTGKEFINDASSLAFEDRAVAAIKACTKPCAVP